MRKTREEKAITLIALIITIVVLLILAVVAINSVTGDGIIQHATNARDDYEKAQDEEQDVLSYYEQYLETEGKTGDWIQDKTIVKNVKTGQEIEVGEKVNNYTANNYEWYVLGAENGYLLLTTNENLETGVTDDAGNPVVVLKGSTAGWSTEEYRFVGAENSLHDTCKAIITELGDATSVRSIKIEDINRITGFNPLTDESCSYGRKVTYRAVIEENEVTGMEASYVTSSGQTVDWDVNHNYFLHPDGRVIMPDTEWAEITDITGLDRTESIEITSTYQSYVFNEYLMDAEKALSLLLAEKDYFLASTGVYSYQNESGHSSFYLLVSTEAGGITGTNLWKSNGETVKNSERKKGVRPVVYMSPDFQPTV